MACPWAIVECYEPLPRRNAKKKSPPPILKRKLTSQNPAQLPLQFAGISEGTIPTCQSDCRYKAVAVAIFEIAFQPAIGVPDTTACVDQDLNVPKGIIVWIIERHVAPPCQMAHRAYEGTAAGPKSQFRDQTASLGVYVTLSFEVRTYLLKIQR
jgi:hypothetical protein